MLNMKTARTYSALFLSISLCSVVHAVKTSLSDGSFFDLEKRTYQASQTASPQKITFYLERNPQGIWDPKAAKVLLESVQQEDEMIHRTFLDKGSIKSTASFTSTPKGVTDEPLEFTACALESKPFFSKWKKKVEHNPMTFSSTQIYEIDSNTAGGASIFYRIFEPTKTISQYSKPAPDGCPADFGKLPGVGDNYDRDSNHTDLKKFFQ